MASPSVSPSTRPSLVSKDIVYNVAIGSNMDGNKLKSRRVGKSSPISPLSEGIPCTVPGWALSFDFLFLPPTEPVMAAAVPKPDAILHAVLWKLTRSDYDTLARTEGCMSPTSLYVEAEVEAYPYPSYVTRDIPAGPIKALVFALRFPPRYFPRYLHPSQRYMNMLIAGARAAKLQPRIVHHLENLPVARTVHPRMSGFTRFAMIALFFLYQNERVMLLARHYYRPLIAQAYSNGEAAFEKGKEWESRVWTVLMLLLMAPMAVIGLCRALYQRRDVRKIARGESF